MIAHSPARVYLVRHGETEWNRLGRHQGAHDVPLNARGEAQAAALAARLVDVPFDAAYTSPLVRARATAECVLGDRRLRAATIDAFAELSYGDWAGLTRAEWRRADAARLAAWDAAPWTVTFPRGESLADVAGRALPSWRRLAAVHGGETVLLAGHGHLNRVLLTHALGLGPDAFHALAQENGACVVLDVAPDGSGTLVEPP